MRKKILITTTIVLGIFLLAFILSLALDAGKNNPSKEEKTYCQESERNASVCTAIYMPVCGWFSDNIKCIKYPCAQTYSNSCEACKNSNVDYYTDGECPK